MSSPYTPIAIAGYNASPPPDDGSEIASNQLSWAKHKTKIGDPLKVAIEAVNTNVAAALTSIYGEIQAETDALVTIVDYTKLPFEAERYGFGPAESAADNATALQALINVVAHAGHGVGRIRSRGRCMVNPTFWFEYDVTSNPNFPSSANRQGQITLIGEGHCDLNAWDNGIYQGTFLDFGTDQLVIGDGVTQIRGVSFQKMTMASNIADFVLKYALVSRVIALEDFNVFQLHADGSGVEMDDCFHVNILRCFAYNTTVNTGKGWYLHNSSQAAGLYYLHEVTGLNFNKNFVIGEEGTGGASMNGVFMTDCQGKDGAYNLIMGNGVKASIVDNFHDEGPTTLGVLLAWGATNVSLRTCYHSNAGASADYMSIGKNGGTNNEDFTRNIHVVNNQFVAIQNAGIKCFSSPLTMNTKVELCTFLGDSGVETGVDVEDVGAHGLFVGPNYYANLGTNISNPTRVNVLIGEDTLGRVTYQSPQTFAGHAETIIGVDSATDIPWIDTSNLWRIAGTTTINTIAAPTDGNPRITLLFTTSLTVNDDGTAAGNLVLAGGVDFSATVNDVLELVWHSNSSKWVECSRSVN